VFLEWFNALPNNAVWTLDAALDRTVEDRNYDPQLMCCAEDEDGPVGFVLGSIANETGWIRAFIVRSDRRRQGIGTLLFERLEHSFAARGISDINVGWSLPRYFLPGIDIAYTPAIVFLDRLGYETDRKTRVNMEVTLTDRDFDTTQDEHRLLEEGVRVRRGEPSDRPGVTDLCHAYNNMIWVIESGIALGSEPPTVFVAERQGTICGFAAHSVCGPVHFGPMLTSSELRGLGIGSVLLKRCLCDFQGTGLGCCEITWAGPLSFYARSVGARIGRAFWTFHKSL
jgi:GNAT superfamily N-acetyltransferase